MYTSNKEMYAQSATIDATAVLCARIVHPIVMDLEPWQCNALLQPHFRVCLHFLVHFHVTFSTLGNAVGLCCSIEFNITESQNQNQMQIELKSLIFK